MSRFDQAELLNHINEVDRRMDQAKQQMLSFASSVTEGVYPRWSKYVALEDDTESLEASRTVFAGKARTLVDECKPSLAAALDIIAGGMRNSEGEPLTRQDLLNELAAVVVPQE